MALADPQTITVATVAKTLNRIKTSSSANSDSSVYRTADEEYEFIVSHQESKGRTRRMVRINKRIVVENPLSELNEWKDLGVHLVIDEPEIGFTDTEIWDVIAGFKTWLDNTNVLKVLSHQS